MKRREFIWLLGGAAAWPLGARAQQLPLVGFVRSSSLAEARHLTLAFRQGLRKAGFIEDHTVILAFRSTEDRPEQIPALISDLIGRQASVLVGDTTSALAAKAAALTTPFVFASGTDPVRDGLVASLSRPGGNVTGVVFFNSVLGAKRLELLRQLAPTARALGLLVNLSNRANEAERSDIEAAALAVGQRLLVQDVRSEADIRPAVAGFVQRGAGALLVGSGAFLNSNRRRVVALAASHALPAAYSQRETVAEGGLMSYGASIPEAYRQVGLYVGRILKGEKPSDLPVMQAVKFEFALNLKIPDRLVAIADEVIE